MQVIPAKTMMIAQEITIVALLTQRDCSGKCVHLLKD